MLISLQLDAGEQSMDELWMGVEFKYNDGEFKPTNEMPSHTHCGIGIIDPSSPQPTGDDARDWRKLNAEWNEVRGAVTKALPNYLRR
jgi:hypothetical protein